jgi:hypothetical protein
MTLLLLRQASEERVAFGVVPAPNYQTMFKV